ncbi:phosphonate ABC transporter ATP-binding protein [Xenophilus arseniciresistens]|uniref:Phosphonate ABC transporter ATP-binding protein n=1 Tax=Xenophilus arseniciresistens TaxID=1283306 RepID=A0AAE3NCA1_9BURK|nr:phosphonate ABC transporter ATP-binding protein [Xenophilus arseniciresistens]MDA7417702.1 phosphonate ABC transporter ATP-binding protein [Xenophilus arseniciresistens]
MNPTVLSAQAVSRSFGKHQALRKVSLEVRRGERVALLGASGSGKSTLIRCLCGLESTDADGGRIEAFGQLLQAKGRISPEIRALRRRIGVIFQQFNLVGRLSVMHNVMTGLAAEAPLWRALSGRYAEADQARALDALDAIGLAPQAFQRASTLSGGQQQRAAIARVLLQGAELVLADEPVASLDPQSTHRVMEQLAALNREAGMTLVVSLHHVALAQRYCERVVALRDGALVFDGPSSALTPGFLQHLYGTAAADLLHEPGTDASVNDSRHLALAA